jgi:hypothetical protein
MRWSSEDRQYDVPRYYCTPSDPAIQQTHPIYDRLVSFSALAAYAGRRNRDRCLRMRILLLYNEASFEA